MLSGLLLAALCLVTVPSAAFQIWFLLTRRADTTPQVLVSTILRFVTGVGRLVGLPAAAAPFVLPRLAIGSNPSICRCFAECRLGLGVQQRNSR